MNKTYDPQSIEQRWPTLWEEVLSQKTDDSVDAAHHYCIMLPPPNITGTLHMGHGFQQTLMDVLIRHKRMQGDCVRWQPGTDHAGIATQIVVEQQLLKEGLTRHDLGRDAFVARVWTWRDASGHTITQQMRRLGLSIDWPHERFSMDERMSFATREAFIRLYEEGLIYRGKRLVNWDPALQSAISDLEVTSKETEGKLWTIRYPLTLGEGFVSVATTRPETLFGDTAIAVHPNDTRYQALIGQTACVPLTNRIIPIIADETIDPAFGTGCVKITPAHDFSDYLTGERHQLAFINIMTADAHLNEQVPEAFRGLERFAARQHVIEALTEQRLLEKTESHRLSVPISERSGVIIEPRLTDQWFMKMADMAKPAMAAIQSGQLKLIPAGWEKTYTQWLTHIQDWCISRQLWWGHQLPIWYDEENHIYVGHGEENIRQKYKLSATTPLRRDTDVLDTWFSASLWPFATLGWPEKTNDYRAFYPTQVLVTGFDIIFFWVARMVMMGIKLTHRLPFSEVYITGLIRDARGQKMSKSKGNILDPIDVIDGITLDQLIEKRTRHLLNPAMADTIAAQSRKEFPQGIAAYGADALRFTYCALANTGRDINFDMGRIDGYRHFCNKLWNAARFVLMHMDSKDTLKNPLKPQTITNRWILHQLQNTIAETELALADYRFDQLANGLYQFIWHEYCDWYLEFAKCVLYDQNKDPSVHQETRTTLLVVLDTILRLLHPLMPFITEEIWHSLPASFRHEKNSILLTPYPKAQDFLSDHKASQAIAWVKAVIIAIRTLRSEMGISPAKIATVIFDKGNAADKHYADEMSDYIKKLAKIDEIRWHLKEESLSDTATGLVDHLEIHLPLAGLIDTAAEIKRLEKEIAQLEKEEQKLKMQLNHPQYKQKAPKIVVEKTQQQLQQTENALIQLRNQRRHIEKLSNPNH